MTYQEHAEQLAKENNIRLLTDDDIPELFAHSHPLDRIVEVPRITNAAIYAIALHEMGHCVCQHDGNSEMMLLSGQGERVLSHEQEAWQWARDHAMEWTEEMTAMEDMGLSSYRKGKELLMSMTDQDKTTATVDEVKDRMNEIYDNYLMAYEWSQKKQPKLTRAQALFLYSLLVLKAEGDMRLAELMMIIGTKKGYPVPNAVAELPADKDIDDDSIAQTVNAVKAAKVEEMKQELKKLEEELKTDAPTRLPVLPMLHE